jgi:hypothetical protein
MDISLSENVIANSLSKEELPPPGSVFQVIATKKIKVIKSNCLKFFNITTTLNFSFFLDRHDKQEV